MFKEISKLTKLINMQVFLLSFLMGLLWIYFGDDKRKISVYPTPHNAHKVEYKDKAQNCFEYTMEEVKCPTDKAKIQTVPVQ